MVDWWLGLLSYACVFTHLSTWKYQRQIAWKCTIWNEELQKIFWGGALPPPQIPPPPGRGIPRRGIPPPRTPSSAPWTPRRSCLPWAVATDVPYKRPWSMAKWCSGYAFSLSQPSVYILRVLSVQSVRVFAVMGCLSMCPSRSWIVSKRINISAKIFNRRVATLNSDDSCFLGRLPKVDLIV